MTAASLTLRHGPWGLLSEVYQLKENRNTSKDKLFCIPLHSHLRLCSHPCLCPRLRLHSHLCFVFIFGGVVGQSTAPRYSRCTVPTARCTAPSRWLAVLGICSSLQRIQQADDVSPRLRSFTAVEPIPLLVLPVLPVPPVAPFPCLSLSALPVPAALAADAAEALARVDSVDALVDTEGVAAPAGQGNGY